MSEQRTSIKLRSCLIKCRDRRARVPYFEQWLLTTGLDNTVKHLVAQTDHWIYAPPPPPPPPPPETQISLIIHKPKISESIYLFSNLVILYIYDLYIRGNCALLKNLAGLVDWNFDQDRVLDSKIHGATMGPTWALLVPDGPHVGLMNLAFRGIYDKLCIWMCCALFCDGYIIIYMLTQLVHLAIFFRVTLLILGKFVELTLNDIWKINHYISKKCSYSLGWASLV